MVLILGGRTPLGPQVDAEWYDPATETFTPCKETMFTAREDFGMGLLPNGEVLILGGRTRNGLPTSAAERFDPRSQRFAPTSPMKHPRHNPTVVSLPSGKVVVLGGSDAAGEPLAEVEVYELAGGFAPQRPWPPLGDAGNPVPSPWAPLREPEEGAEAAQR
jgi:hypothetical protein